MKAQAKLLVSEALYKINYLISKNSDGDVDKILRGLKNNGCYKIDSFLDRQTCKDLCNLADDFIDNNPDKIKVESNGSDIRVYGVDRYSNDFNVGKVDEISNRIFDMFSIKLTKDGFKLLGRIEASDDNLGSGGGWHRDAPFQHQFKTLLYLTDVEISNGPFQYIKRSNLYSKFKEANKFLGKELNDHRFTEEEIEKLISNNIVDKPTVFTAPAGTLLFADTRGLHRGMPLEEGKRYAITHYHFGQKVDEQKFIK